MRAFLAVLASLGLAFGFMAAGQNQESDVLVSKTYTVYDYARFENDQEVERKEDIHGTTITVVFGEAKGDVFQMTIGDNPAEEFMLTEGSYPVDEDPEEIPFVAGQFHSPTAWGAFQMFEDKMTVEVWMTKLDYTLYEFRN